MIFLWMVGSLVDLVMLMIFGNNNDGDVPHSCTYLVARPHSGFLFILLTKKEKLNRYFVIYKYVHILNKYLKLYR